ncbi:hypothetical protein ACX3M4_04585 [Roseibium sp. M-1]
MSICRKQLHDAMPLEIVEIIRFTQPSLDRLPRSAGLFQFTIDFYGKFRKPTQNTRHSDALITWSSKPGSFDWGKGQGARVMCL